MGSISGESRAGKTLPFFGEFTVNHQRKRNIMPEIIKPAVAVPALQLARGISVVGTVVSDFVVKEFVSKKGMPCRILRGMVSCGSGVIVSVQRFLDKDEVVPVLPKEGDAYTGRVGPETEGETLRLTLLKGVEVAK
jgi:hypothetical protein